MDNIIEIKFDKGLNSAVDSFSCPEGHCLTFSDYQLDYGVVKPRTSFNKVNASAINSSSSQVRMMFPWIGYSAASQNPFLYFEMPDSSGKIYRSNALYDPTQDGAVAVTDVTGTYSTGSQHASFESFSGKLIVASGGLWQVSNNASNFAAVTPLGGSVAKPTCVKAVNNILFISGGMFGGDALGSVSSISWSNVGDPTTWPAGSSLDFRANDGDFIIALSELNGSVLIFKTQSIGLLGTTSITTSGTVTLSPMTTLFKGIGALGPHAVDTTPDGRVIFLGSDLNVYITDGSTLVNLTYNGIPGFNVRPTISSLITSVYSHFSLKYDSFRQEVWVCVKDNTPTTTVLVFDLVQKYWRTLTGITTKAGAAAYLSSFYNLYPATSSNVNNSTMYLGNNVGNVFDLNRNNNASPTDEAGAAVTPNISTSVVLPPNFVERGYMWLTIIYSSSNNVTYAYGFDGTYGSNLTLSSSNKRADIKISYKGSTTFQKPSTFQIKFVDTGGASIYRVFLSMEGTN